jgi:hypothetical protein
MNDHEARQRIRTILETSGFRICYSKHGGQRARERQIPLPDVVRLFRSGFVAQPPYQEAGREEWTCVLEGPDADGRTLRVVVGVHFEQPVLIIVSAMRV